MAEPVSPQRTTVVRAAGAVWPADRCPRCGVPQGPFAERRKGVVTCIACGARFTDDGTLWPRIE